MTFLVKILLWLDVLLPKSFNTGWHLPPQRRYRGSSSWTRHGGVWVENRLYYQAINAFMGTPPEGEDVKDLAPGIPNSVFGGCGCCLRSWKWVESHNTNFDNGNGCFPLCETCWERMTPEQRLPFYEALVDIWVRGNPSDAERYAEKRVKIRRAVLEGK